MLLQINQNEGGLSNSLQTTILQEYWHVLLLVTILIITIVWRLFKQKNPRSSLASEIPPASEYHNYQAYLEQKAASKVEKTQPTPKNEIPVKVLQTVITENQPDPVPVKTDPKDTILKVPATTHTDDKIITLRPIEKTAVVHLSAKEQSVPRSIGYDPAKIVIHPGEQTYPYIVLPKANSKVTLPQEGRTGRQGYKDADFKRHLSMAFGNILQVDDNKLLLTNSGIAYSPDISLIDTSDGLNLFIDIEIDEPYEGTNDIENRKAIHYIGCDENRNKAFGDSGWIVIRLAEIQVHQNPTGCCLYVADILSKVIPNFVLPNHLKYSEIIEQIPQWKKVEGEVMSKNRYREKYLALSKFGISEEASVIYKVATTENISSMDVVAKEPSLENLFYKTLENIYPDKDIQKQYDSIVSRIAERQKKLASLRTSISNEITEELKPYCQHEKWGYVNKSGETRIQCIYDFATDFKEGVARVRRGEKWGVIDKRGHAIISCIYDEIASLESGIFVVGFRNVLRSRHGIFDKCGKQIMEVKYHNLHTQKLKEGIVKIGVWENGLKHFDLIYFSKTGELDKYDSIQAFHEGLAAVCINNKYGYIDEMGSIAIRLKYDEALKFNQGFAVIRINSKYGLVDKNGKEVCKCKYEEEIEGHIQSAKNSIVFKVKFNGKYGLIDNVGSELIACKYETISLYGELVIGRRNEKYDLLQITGVKIGEYDKIEKFSYGLAAVKLHDKYGYINSLGTLEINPIYSKAGSFYSIAGSSNLSPFSKIVAYVEKDGEWGYINIKGEVSKDGWKWGTIEDHLPF